MGEVLRITRKTINVIFEHMRRKKVLSKISEQVITLKVN